MTTKILITGGATGLGKSIALVWAKQSNQPVAICIADIHQQRGEATLKTLQDLGVKDAYYHHCDISKQSDVDQLHQTLMELWSSIDIVINNAGIASGGSVKGESIEQWQSVLTVNLLGLMRVTKAFYPTFKAQGQGYFINIASQAGITPLPYMGSYNASKAAVISISETMKLELAMDNIDVSVVCPAFFKTNLDESLRTTEPVMHSMVQRAFKKAPINAEQVAQIIYQQAQQRQFLILTHKQGKWVHLFKKLLPMAFYLKIMLNRTSSTRHFMAKNSGKSETINE